MKHLKLSPIYAFLAVWAILQVYPIVYMFVSSFKSDPENLSSPWRLPSEWMFENYAGAWRGVGNDVTLGDYFMNSVVVTGGSLLLVSLIAMLAGYALARYSFPGSKVVYALNLAVLAVPVHALMVPVYQYLTEFNLLNTRVGLILVYTAFNLPFSIIIMRSYFETIPKAVEEAATIDGCRPIAVFWHVGVPIAKGAVATIIIINVVGIWSELMFASVLVPDPSYRTLPVGVSQYAATMYGTTTGYLFATLTLTAVPLLIIYFIFQKQIVKGATFGAIK